MGNKVNIFHKDVSILFTLSEKELLKKFRKCSEVSKHRFYFDILLQVNNSIITGEMSHLMKMNSLLSCMINEVDCQIYSCSPNNPLRNVNIIILACKYCQPEILDFILSDKCKILEHGSIAYYYNLISPTDIDEYQHNAFYYTIRSGKTRIIEILKNKWPDEYPFINSEKIHDTLVNAYRELKWKNVELSIEMEYFVRNEIFEKEFYDDCQIHDPGQTSKKVIKNPNSKTQISYKQKPKSIANHNLKTEIAHKKNQKKITNDNGKTQKSQKLKQKHIANQTADDQFKKDIAKRIELVLYNIETLKRDFETIDVDETFLVIAKFIAKNVHALKIQLKFTYDKIPWAEIEFCLVIFIKTLTESKENHLLHSRNLTKEKLLSYLNFFAECIEKTQSLIRQSEVKELLKWPTLKALQAIDKDIENSRSLREACELRILKINPLLKELYKDYYRMRDEYSLRIMERYLDLAISVECEETGRIVIGRTLQVVGENLKNTLESPKLSDTTCDLLLFSLPENTREIVKSLRDSLSHAESMSKRMKIEKGDEVFFNRIKDDLKKLNIEIGCVLCQFMTRIIGDDLRNIIKCENEGELKELLKSLHVMECTGEEMSVIPELSLLKKMDNFLKELSCSNIVEKTENDIYIINQLNNAIYIEQNKLEKTHHTFLNIFSYYSNFLFCCQQGTFENIKNQAKILFREYFLQIDDSNSGLDLIVRVLSESFIDIVFKCLKGKELETFTSLYSEFLHFAEQNKIKLIEDYNFDIKDNKRYLRAPHKQPTTKLIVDPDTNTNLISEKLNQLKNAESTFNDLVSFKNSRKYQAVVEMLVLDIYSLLEECLLHNQLFLYIEPVTLIGRNMRNHLAHENLLISILSSCTFIDLALNGNFFLEECTLNNTRKIGKVSQCNIASLEVEYKQELGIIALQKEMFLALSNGDLETVKSTLQKGADIQARYMRHKTALHFASEGSSIETIKLVLGENCEFDARDEKGQSALQIATCHGRSNIVEYLIKNRSIFVDQLDRDRKTLLHIAAEHGHLGVVEVLIQLGASTTVKDGYGYSPLHYSIKNNHNEVVKALLNKEDSVDDNDGFGGETPLFIASESGHLEIVDYLIKEGANVNAKKDTMEVPLHAAVKGGHLETVRTLIEKGKSLNARNIHGNTALHMASRIGHESILRLLLENETNVDDELNILKSSPLSFAAEYGHTEIVKLLLKHKAKVDMKDVTGKTPLHFAAEGAYQRIVEILVNKIEKDTTLSEKKSFLDEKDILGRTALHYSAFYGHESIVQLLITEGSSIDCIDIYKNTPLILAVENGHLNITKVLIKNNADINHTNILNETALHKCFERQCLDIASLLIERKANIHEKSLAYGISPFHLALGVGSKTMLETFINGGADIEDIKTTDFTALHLAIINGDLEVIEYLIVDLNCDVNIPSKSGLTALHLAAQHSNMDAMELLCKNGSDLNMQDNKGYTPLYYAVISNNKKIIKYLIEKKATIKAELLALAVANCCHDVLTFLLDKGTFDVNIVLAHNYSLLGTSIVCRHIKIAEMLLENGANINAKSNNQTPLFFATVYKDIEMIKLLLDKGADPNLPSGEEEITPLYLAVTEGRTDIVKILLEGGAQKVDTTSKSALQQAVECGRVEIVNFLLENEYVDVNERINGLCSILHVAVLVNELEVVKYLVVKGADINARSVIDQTPIILAIEGGHKDIVEFLHKFSSKELLRDVSAVMLNVENCDETLLHVASKFNQKDILLYFLDNGVYYNVKNRNGKTALQVTRDSKIKCALQQVENVFNAIERNELELLNDAIEKGAILNAKRKDNVTPLHFSAWKGRRNISKILLEKGANPNIIGKCKSTPLHYAAKFGHFDIVRMLLSHGAIYNILSESGKTPLEYSTHKNVIRLLSLVDKSFKSVQIGKLEFLEELKTLTGPEEIKSVMKSRNKENKLLVTSAISHDFPEYEQLKQILTVDTSPMYPEAAVLRNIGNYSKYLKNLEDNLKIKTEGLGHDHPDTLNIKDDIGAVLLNMNDLDEALKVLEDNLKTRKESLGANHKSTVHTKWNLAFTLFYLNKNSEALKMLQEVYCQQIIIFSENDSEVLQTQRLIAQLLYQEKKYEAALELLRTNYESNKELYGELNPKSIVIQVDIANILSTQEKHEEAIKQLQHCEKIKTIEGKENHSTILEIRLKTANIYRRAGNYDKAIKIYKGMVGLFLYTELNFDTSIYWEVFSKLGAALVSKGSIVEGFTWYCKANAMDPSPFLTKKMKSIKNLYSSIFGCVLEQIENEISCATEGSRETLDEEERIQQASDIYLKQIKRDWYCSTNPYTRLKYEDWNTEEMSENHFIEHYSELSRFCAMAEGEELEVSSETFTKFIDKDVFAFMTNYENKRFEIVKKFNNNEFI